MCITWVRKWCVWVNLLSRVSITNSRLHKMNTVMYKPSKALYWCIVRTCFASHFFTRRKGKVCSCLFFLRATLFSPSPMGCTCDTYILFFFSLWLSVENKTIVFCVAISCLCTCFKKSFIFHGFLETHKSGREVIRSNFFYYFHCGRDTGK